MKLYELAKVVNNDSVKSVELYDVADDTLEKISQEFVNNHLETFVVLKNKKPYYIFTSSDLIEALVDGYDKLSLFQYIQIKEKDLIVANINESIFEAYLKIRNKKIHHLIVVDENGDFYKVVTIGDFAQFLTEIAIKDPLTGLYNRRFFEFLLDKFQNEDLEVGIIFLDVNKFKELNDKYGHDFGDTILKKISNIIKRSIRNIDYAFRVGGDEFIVMVVATVDILDKIAKRLEKSLNFEYKGVKISVSIGYAHYKNDSDDIKKVIELADKRMYQNKRSKYDDN
jgi:diguanylate cyclase (GGDEF)-like protein